MWNKNVVENDDVLTCGTCRCSCVITFTDIRSGKSKRQCICGYSSSDTIHVPEHGFCHRHYDIQNARVWPLPDWYKEVLSHRVIKED